MGLPSKNFNKEELLPLDVSGMKGDCVTDFDLYVEVGGHLVLYAPSPYKWTEGEIKRLIADGHLELLYEKDNEAKVKAYRKIGLIRKINEDLPPVERIKDITDVAAEFNRVLFDHPLDETTHNKAKQIADSLVECVKEDPLSVRALGLLSEHDMYTYYHSGRVSAYAVAVAIKMSISQEQHLREIAMGCLLHDVGKSKVDLKILTKAGPLTEREWDLMKKHPEFGLQLVSQKALLSIVPMEIILHHHERIDGKGYPHGLGRNEILEEVGIAAFSDIFDALTSNRPYQKSRTRYEALDFIRFNLIEQINKEAFKAMVEIHA
ncbi:MAG: HD domain-containing protein [Oligoflexales bacterium]|nr:HD domain-containing protein [Oligoflexales bacterium]